MNKSMLLSSLIILTILLSACGTEASQEEVYGKSPSSVDQELWDQSHRVISIIQEMMDKKEDTTEDQNEVIINFRESYFIDEETFNSKLYSDFSQEERVLILQTMNAILTFRFNIFDLEENGRDRLTETLVQIEEFHSLANSFPND